VPHLFHDRHEAGKLLALRLSRFKHLQDVVVLALPRGGVPVGFEIAQELGAPLDILVVRKLGVPDNEELAMGAVASGKTVFINERVVQALQIPREMIEGAIDHELREVQRRETLYGSGDTIGDLKGKIVILVDDGIATGSTLTAAIQAARHRSPAHIVVAVPVAPPSVYGRFAGAVDGLEVLATPRDFFAVGQAYDEFDPVEDAEVRRLLSASRVRT